MNSGRRSDADLQGDTVKKTDIPVGYYVWHISPRFGDVVPATPDTLPHWFQNANLTDGYNGTYNFLGNMGAPRISRLYFERDERITHSSFIFAKPYDFFLKKPEQIFFSTPSRPSPTLPTTNAATKARVKTASKPILPSMSTSVSASASTLITCTAAATMPTSQQPISAEHYSVRTSAANTSYMPTTRQTT